MANEAMQFLLDELLIDCWGMPCVYWEDETDAFIVGGSELSITDILNLVGRKLGNVLSDVAAVACA